MTLFRWLSTAFSPARKRPIRVRLNVERLEDRLTPTAGLLDPTFGAGAGYVLGSFSNANSANAVAIQSDGKIVIAGATSSDILVARYNADGSLDTSFGTGGYTATIFKQSMVDWAVSVAIQSDGKILVGGGATKQNKLDYSFLARYNANGTLDTTFGSNGEVVIPQAGGDDIAVQTDGKILVSVVSSNNSPADLFRYNANGTLDTTFGNGGEIVTNFNFFGGHESILQPDGKIVLAGNMSDPTSGITGLGVARFNADGTTDSSFGSGGEVVTHVGSEEDEFGGVALQSDGNIVVGGVEYSGSEQLCLIQYNANGALDTAFGSGTGIDIVPPPAGYSEVVPNSVGVEVQSDGKIVASAEPGPPGGVWGAVRVNADGTLDTSYGNGGWATVVIGYANDVAASALQPDGWLLLAGSERPTTSGTPRYAVLIRFTGDTTPTTAAPAIAATPAILSVTAGTTSSPQSSATLAPASAIQPDEQGAIGTVTSPPSAVTTAAADQLFAGEDLNWPAATRQRMDALPSQRFDALLSMGASTQTVRKGVWDS